jgi:hypothetical protein
LYQINAAIAARIEQARSNTRGRLIGARSFSLVTETDEWLGNYLF